MAPLSPHTPPTPQRVSLDGRRSLEAPDPLSRHPLRKFPNIARLSLWLCVCVLWDGVVGQ